jgi:hypothetical protein
MEIEVNKIVINGRDHDWNLPEITYEQVVDLARQPRHSTVTYWGRPKDDYQRMGSMYAGKTVSVEDGMHFDAVVTGNA